MTLVGVCVSLSGAGLLGLDGRLVPSPMLAFICHLRAWMLTVGFSLSYGAMFAKIWSVHSLATKAKAQGTKVGGNKILKYKKNCLLRAQ